MREGTSTLTRVLAALSAGYAKIDERDAADIILFAKHYAAYLNYYNSLNSPAGDWQALMNMDASVVLATIDKTDLRKISDYKKLLYKRITLAATDADAKKEFKFLFDLLFSLISLIDEQCHLLPDEFEYKSIISDIIQNKLQLPAANLIKCFKDFKARSLPHPLLLDYTTCELDGEAPMYVNSEETFDTNKLSWKWESATADIVMTLPDLPDSKSTIVYIINHNLFNAQVELLLNGIAGLVKYASTLFDQTIENFPKHTPHYGLFLTFVKLFRFAQDHLNTYTKRHLDFYYKDVLQLQNKKPEPDSAHLTFELQKPVNREILKKGSLFKGGKDITGKEITYALAYDLVINKAAIAKIQSWQKTARNNKEVLIASPVANSDDGMGAKIKAPDKSWITFGDVKKAGYARVGFAIASNILFLKEGKRKITITVTFANNIPELTKLTGANTALFKASLTGEKDWLDQTVATIYNDTEKKIVFTILLTPDDPAIIPYSEKIHKEIFISGLPLLRIFLNQETTDPIDYSVLCKQKITQIDISTDVKGVKDLMLSNDAGSIDASKPFKPFGDFPDTNSSFYIGSKEIFQKTISELTINYSDPGQIRTQKYYSKKKAKTGSGLFDSATFYLDEGTWKTFNDLTGYTISDINVEPVAIDFTPNEILKPTSLNGFIRLLNTADKSINTYLNKIKTALDKTTLTRDATYPSVYRLNVGQPPAPEEIKITKFSVDYKATSSINFSAPGKETVNNLFFHLTPFGHAEVYYNDGTAEKSQAEQTEKYTLLVDVIKNGELFIGLDNTLPDTVITVFFQVADGSANPLKKMQALDWFYLSKNEWILFDERNIIDGTRNFTQSGIVTLTLSSDISNDNTLFQKGLSWIKVAIEKEIDAVCNMILIQAQAVCVSLVQDEAGQVEFRQTLPSGTISKLVISDGAIKTITQPFDSFDGRTRESDEHFYVRVSERLRHKQRSVSIWDYEHIILGKFSGIYKVKCVNHAGFIDKIFFENFPGHVTIVPVPDLKNKTTITPLRPYTPIGLLTDIEDYLKTITSPFVKLDVRNPKFEEIRLSFKVQFYDHIDVSAFQQILNLEIEKFLSPWAYQEGVDISFGGKIIKSVLLNFVEERPYVDYVTCFKMDHIIDRNGMAITNAHYDVEEAVASTSCSVLVSYLNEEAMDESQKRHLIDTVITCVC